MTQEEINGIAHEVNFWRGFVPTARFRENWASGRINPELEQRVIDLIVSISPDSRVLDVGSGPVSILRGLVPDDRLTAADPLSEFYQGLFDYKGAGITPPVPVRAEDLPEVFDEFAFDIVHIRNAFDHTQRPYVAFTAMQIVLSHGGRLIIHGFENEADAENWQGLHQWNCRIEPGELIVEGRDGVHFRLSGNTARHELANKKTWFTFWI